MKWSDDVELYNEATMEWSDDVELCNEVTMEWSDAMYGMYD